MFLCEKEKPMKKFYLLLGLLLSAAMPCFAENGVWEGTKEVADDTWDGTKEVTGDVWDGTKKVTSDVWDGTKKVARDVKDGVTGSDTPAPQPAPNGNN